jgi:hypothetical protein
MALESFSGKFNLRIKIYILSGKISELTAKKAFIDPQTSRLIIIDIIDAIMLRPGHSP